MVKLFLVVISWIGPFIIQYTGIHRDPVRFIDYPDALDGNGFYQIYDASGAPLYIGKTDKLTVRSRLVGHKRTNKLFEFGNILYYIGNVVYSDSNLAGTELFTSVESLLISSNKFILNHKQKNMPRLRAANLLIINRGEFGVLKPVSCGLQFYPEEIPV